MKRYFSMFLLTLFAFASLAKAQTASPPTFKVCGGADGGQYQAYAANVFKQFNDGKTTGSVSANILTTGGSYENIDKMLSNECQAGMVQNDVLTYVLASRPQAKMNFEVAAKPFQEAVHIICAKDVVGHSLSDIEKHADDIIMIVGNESGGSHFTWQKLSTVSKRLMSIPISNKSGLRALSIVSEDGSLDDVNGKRRKTCMVYVGRKGIDLIRQDAEVRSARLKLMAIDMESVFSLKGPKGEALYTKDSDVKSIYPRLFSDWSWTSPSLAVTSSVLIFRTDWIDANEAAYNRLNRQLATKKQ
jgi:NMT1-like family